MAAAPRLRVATEQAIVATFLIAVGLLGCLATAEPDTFWHLRAGRDIVANGSVALIDTYSYTAAGRFWPNHEWLWEVATYLLYALGRFPLVATAAGALVVATFAMVTRLTTGPLAARLGLVGLAVLASGAPWSLRPHLFTHAALVATLWLVARERLWPLPFLFLLWTNVHGAVVLGFVVLAGGLLVTAWEHDVRRSVRHAAVTAACGLATLASPLGLRLYSFIEASMAKSRLNGVSEWRPTSFELGNLPFFVASASLIVLAAVARRRLSRHEDRVAVVVALLMIPLAIRAVRNLALFWLLLPPAASRLLFADGVAGARAPGHDPSSGAGPSGHGRDVAVVGVLAAAFVIFAWALPLPFLKWNPMSAEAAAAVRACPGHVFNQYDQGGVLLWFVPEKPVFIDGRQDPYPVEFLSRARALATNEAMRRAAFEEYDIHCAALSGDSTLAAVLARDGWRVQFRDDKWIVLSN